MIYEISKEKVEGGCDASCYINGELYGEGVGRNVDTAKTKAAWRAFYSILHGQPNFEPREYNESLTLCIRETPKRIFEDPDEMQHNAALHRGLHCLQRWKSASDNKYNIFENYNLTPLDMYNGLQWTKIIVSSQKEGSISIQRVKREEN